MMLENKHINYRINEWPVQLVLLMSKTGRFCLNFASSPCPFVVKVVISSLKVLPFFDLKIIQNAIKSQIIDHKKMGGKSSKQQTDS